MHPCNHNPNPSQQWWQWLPAKRHIMKRMRVTTNPLPCYPQVRNVSSLQSTAAAHCNSIAKGALKCLLPKELKQDAIVQQQKNQRAPGNMPSQKAKAKTITSVPKQHKKPNLQLQKKLQSAVHAMKHMSSKGGHSSLFHIVVINK